MIRNYLKVAWRNIVNSKGYSAINIFGLSAGMAVAMLIALWVVNEFSWDKSYPDYRQLYQVKRNFNSNGDTLTFNSTSLKLANVLRAEIPEMEYVCEASWTGPHGLLSGEHKLFVSGTGVDKNFLKMFGLPMLEGDRNTALNDPYSIVLSESIAVSLFGKESPIGKTVRMDNTHDLRVTGVMKDLPTTSSFRFKYLFPFSYLEQTDENVRANRNGSFGANGYQLYVKLKPGTANRVAGKILNIEKTETKNANAMNSAVILHPIADTHLYGKYVNGKVTGGFIDYVRIFSLIGILVLAIAIINFVNLTTARSEKRSKEVGIRKAVGSYRSHLIMQFLAEALLLTGIAFCFCLLMVYLLLPAFNRLTRNEISIPFTSIYFWLITVSATILTGISAGLKPAFYLSSFNPVTTLKGTMKVGQRAVFSRKALVVAQFTCSIALIISTITVYRQMKHVKERPTGFNTDLLLQTISNNDVRRHYEPLKNELLQSGLVTAVATASSSATDVDWHTDIDYWPGKLEGETIEMGAIEISNDYFKTMGMELLSGRDFSAAAVPDSTNVLLNEAAVKRMRLKDPLNQTLVVDGRKYHVIGIVRNALVESPFSEVGPVMFLRSMYPESIMLYRMAAAASPHAAIAGLTEIFNRHSAAFPFTYKFVNEEYGAKFRQEELIGRLSGIFALLAVLISCLGLLGLAAYMAEQRTKEIGVRKVLGATVAQIWFLLSRDFITLVMLSSVIAAPLALYFLQRWLQQYEYRISIGAGVFFAAAAIALVITLSVISLQAIKAAIANPVKSLRSE
ncbi:FtsX-like permease family protein [Chitinophaga sp. Mgbs1]|uniref:FtsX-like permease family protein n=1 Tax=Chitinophaga solisilvae TaxID=1233460 RepID=A0A3S1CW65_9BACT|nr:FtsX-like permease family protein [Chitinophaga solisilvae]